MRFTIIRSYNCVWFAKAAKRHLSLKNFDLL